MIRDEAILVRPDGSVMFDSPAPKARRAAESRDAWLARTVGKAVAEQGGRGTALVQGERIAPEERPDSKVRDAVRIDRLTGKLTVDFDAARALLLERFKREAAYRLGKLKTLAEAARWFAPIADPGVVAWDRQLAALESESRRLAGELEAAKAVEDLLAIVPAWPDLKEGTSRPT